MSGWDASMPSREPERHRSGGAPRHAPGAPPDVFEPAYRPFEPDYGREDFAPRRRAENGGYDGDASGLGSNGRHGRPGGGREDYPGQDYARGDYGQRYGREDHAQAGHARRDYPGGDTVDPDYAARMDPALQDFFAPQPSRSDFAPPTRQPGRLSGPQPGLQPGPQQGRLSGPQPGLPPGRQSGPQPGLPPGRQSGPQPGLRPGPKRNGQPARPTRPNRPPHRQPGQPPQSAQQPPLPQGSRPRPA